MNNKKRFILGLASTLLLACGFIRAAERLDPMSPSASSEVTQRSAASCILDTVGMCNIDDDSN